MKAFLLDLVFPVECLGCGTAGTYMCAGCFARIPVEGSFVCALCGRPSFEGETCRECRKRTALSGLIAGASYRDMLVRRMVTACKYRFVKDLAPHLARLAIKRIAGYDLSVFHRGDLALVPVPLDPARFRWRGFNQAAEMAVTLGRALGISVAENALVRAQKRPPQAETESRAERFRNIRGAFAAWDAQAVRGKGVLLVDDVATTCATLSECARVLKEAGAIEVWGIVAAREA